MTKPKEAVPSAFVLRTSSFFRHSSFVISPGRAPHTDAYARAAPAVLHDDVHAEAAAAAVQVVVAAEAAVDLVAAPAAVEVVRAQAAVQVVVAGPAVAPAGEGGVVVKDVVAGVAPEADTRHRPRREHVGGGPRVHDRRPE